MSPLLVGAGAGFSGDRTDAAAPVVETLVARGGPAALIFETLAERTLALAQLARRANPDGGYEPMLDDLLVPILARCLEHDIRIVSNFGAANPLGAARRIHELARGLGLAAPRIAVVTGVRRRSPMRCAAVRRSWSADAWPIHRSPSGPRWRTSAGAATIGIASGGRP